MAASDRLRPALKRKSNPLEQLPSVKAGAQFFRVHQLNSKSSVLRIVDTFSTAYSMSLEISGRWGCTETGPRVGELIAGILVISSLLVVARNAFAWEKFRHVVLCEIAHRQMTPDARTEVNRILVAHGEFKSFNRACLETDRYYRFGYAIPGHQ